MSQFYRQLDSVGKRRYREKLDMLHLDMDPYLTAPDVWIGSPESWPDVTFPDICTYLLFSPSPCTKDDLKAYKSTEAWKYVTSGYVSGIKLLKISADLCLSQPTCTIHMKLKSFISHLLHHHCRSSIARK